MNLVVCLSLNLRPLKDSDAAENVRSICALLRYLEISMNFVSFVDFANFIWKTLCRITIFKFRNCKQDRRIKGVDLN